MPEVHAKLSPSSGERWINCTASVALADLHPELAEDSKGSVAAQEGTLAHSVLENNFSKLLGRRSDAEYATEKARLETEISQLLGGDGGEGYAQMSEYAEQHIDLVLSIVGDKRGESIIALEERVYPGVPHCFGTSDTIISMPGEIHIVDFKYGRGIPVSPVWNAQLMLYALGSHEAYKIIHEHNTVGMHIVQPRINNVDTWVLGLDELLAWRTKTVLPAVALIERGWGEYKPSPKACQWCPAKAICRVRAEQFKMEAFGEHLDPGELSVEELAAIAQRSEEATKWIRDVVDYATEAAYDGVQIPGVKVIRSGGRRSIPNVEAALEVLQGEGIPAEEVSNTKVSLISLAGLERKLKTKLEESPLAGLIEKSPGKLKLVGEGHKGEEVTRESEHPEQPSFEDSFGQVSA